MRLLAFDPGSVRIGVAVSENGILAAPAGYIKNNEKLKERLSGLVEKHRPEIIVVGRPGSPKNRDRCPGEELADIVRAVDGAPEVVLHDESMTSVEAGRILIGADLSRRKRREKTDGLAAALILQGYIEKRRQEGDG